jgi:hypothetical protein
VVSPAPRHIRPSVLWPESLFLRSYHSGAPNLGRGHGRLRRWRRYLVRLDDTKLGATAHAGRSIQGLRIASFGSSARVRDGIGDRDLGITMELSLSTRKQLAVDKNHPSGARLKCRS